MPTQMLGNFSGATRFQYGKFRRRLGQGTGEQLSDRPANLGDDIVRQLSMPRLKPRGMRRMQKTMFRRQPSVL